MNKENINRLKKYLFLISMFFSFIIGGHIIYVYLYDNAQEIPIEGGSVSEGIIGDFPTLNPLLNNTDYNKNIIYMLYRSLLKYDYEKKEIVGDLANCDIKNLSYIECYLKDNITWSNGEKIKADDVIATYNIIKNSDINNSMNALLKSTTIEQKNGVIIFSNKLSDINFLQSLFQPIVPKSVLDNIGNKELYGKFNPLDGIYSGPYKVDTVSYDDSLGIQKLILTKNENYKEKNILISKYIYKFFKDQSHILKHTDVINVFYDKDKIIGDTMPRLDSNGYYLNQYMSVFLNEERLKNFDLRNFILGKINTQSIIKTLGNGYKEISNPYLADGIKQNNDIKNSNLENIIKDLGFYKKDYLLSKIVEDNKKLEESKEEKILNPDLTYINSPINKKINFLSEDNILIKGVLKDKKADEIYINNYKLSSYKKGDNEFYFRLKTDFKNITTGENKYKVEISNGGKKENLEDFIIYFNANKNELEAFKKTFIENQKKSTQSEEKPTTSSGIEIQKEKISKLDDKYYYDNNLKKLSLKLYYLDNKDETPTVANIIKNSLESYGINIETNAISISDLNKKINSGEKDYDIMLVGIDLGIFDFNIYPYFHSSQSKGGYSFSNIKNLSLDILLEELKSTILTNKKRLELEKKVTQVLNENQVFKSLYAKENIVLIDKNIKKFSIKEHFSSDLAIIDALDNAYVTSDRKIDFSKKSIYDFIKFIKRVFTNEG